MKMKIVLVLRHVHGLHGRMKVAFIQNGQCHMCDATDVRVLCTDSSDF